MNRMKITFTLTQTNKGISYDIQVSHEQRIKDTLQILRENLPMFADVSDVDYVIDADSGKNLSTEDTYGTARVYSGAELLIN